MPSILIIGKNGALGSEFMRLYGDDAFGVDFSELDITDEKAVQAKITQLRPEIIINCAAYNAVDKAEEESAVAEKINGYAVGFIAKAAKEVGALMVHYGTNYVFDGQNQDGYKEDDQPNPQSAYGRSKLLGETELAKYTDRYYIIRTAWLYGQQGSGKQNFIDTMLELVQVKSDIECVADQYGQPTWSYDLARATQDLIATGLPSGIYHRTNNGSASWYTWAEEIFLLKNITVNLIKNSFSNFGRAAQRPQYGLLQTTKLPALRSWQEALQEYLTTSQS